MTRTFWKRAVSRILGLTAALAVAVTGAVSGMTSVQAASAPKIYLSPSKQDANYYSVGDTTEMVQCNRIAQAAEQALLRCGFQVKRAPMGQDMYQSIRESNEWGADLHLPIHTNAKDNRRPDHGTLMLVYDESAMAAAQAIQDQISAITLSHLKQPIEINRSFAELNSTKGMAVYTEVEYHDNDQTAQWIIDHTGAIGEAIAKGVCQYYGYSYVEPCQWQQQGNSRVAVRGSQVLTGWLSTGDGWYYLNQQGVPVVGWQNISGSWFYFGADGVMKTGWLNDGTNTYYLTGSGAMGTGWTKTGRSWHYYNGSGHPLTGWQLSGGKWYYMDQAGKMMTGWQTINGSWYCMEETSGAMLTGWNQLGGSWYYFNGDGTMKTGWLDDGNHRYYLDSNGVMVTGTQIVDGVQYQFDGSGHLI